MSDPAASEAETGLDDDIVLVDDDPMVAEFVRRVLRRSARRLRVFDDPLSALAHLTTHTARVLLVDTRMPDMDGSELLVRLAERGRRGAGRVILCSAGPPVATEWTRTMPEHVETLSKDVLLDRHTLVARLEACPSDADQPSSAADSSGSTSNRSPTRP